MLFRSAGKLLNPAFGWATVMLFGRVPQDRQICLSLVSFGAVIWLLTLVGIAFPTMGTFLPALVGVLATRLVEERPRTGAGFLKTVLRGYLYTVGLSLTLLLAEARFPNAA